jgi:hypothetical protein
MEQIARPGGLFTIFRVIQYIPYIAIGLLVVMMVFWIVFGIKKLRWTKVLAIILTVLVVISALLTFTPYILGTIMGRQIPIGGFFQNKDFPAGDREQFRDFRERKEIKRSGLDIDINKSLVDLENEVVVI